MTNTTTPGRRGRTIPAVLAATAIILTLVATLGLIRAFVANTTGPVDMNGRHVSVEQQPTSPAAASATPSGHGRFTAASVGLNVPLGALNVAANTIEPPGFTSAYWVRNLGVPIADHAKGTVFVAMHSLRNGGVAPGNALIDVTHQTAKISNGATITIDDVDYSVTRTHAIQKTRISGDADVWANTPNRLVVITCLQNATGGPSTQNMIIEATHTSA